MKRLRIIRPYLASWLFSSHPRPPAIEVLRFLFQSDKVRRAQRYQELKMTDDEIFSHIGAEGSVEVEVRRLDELLTGETDRVSLIKADVEGYEFQALLGAEELIRRWRPKITLTVYHSQNNVFEIRDYLRRLHAGYRFRTRGMSESGNPILLQAW
jgi:hypothetical protein